MEKKVRVTMTVRADPNITLFRWAFAWITHAHATAPGRVTFRIEVLDE